MARYFYTLVENTYVVRQSLSKDGAEQLTPEGEWIDYPDLRDVTMNGRPIASEAEALEMAKEIFERNPEWWAWAGRMRAGDEAYQRGDHGEAETHWKAPLEFEVNLGSTRSLDNLAMLYQAQGRYAEAAPLHARALAMVEKSLGPTHADVAGRLENYAALLHEMGCDAEAANMEARATAIRTPE